MLLIDWIIVGLYVVGALVIGAVFTKKASKSTDDFFVAGRSLPWIIAGTSIVATTFSADTPLFVAGMTRTEGIASNWFWWSSAIGQIAAVFFFAKLWRRTEVVTDIEFVIKRYEPSKARTFLRIFKVFYDGVLINCIVMASVTLAMTKILSIILNFSDTPLCVLPVIGAITASGLLLFILGLCAVIYTSLSGLYGVVYTDLIQFGLAMIGSITLAVIVYVDASHGEGMIARMSAAPEFKKALLNFIPEFKAMNLLTISFLIYVFVAWWAAAPGSGYVVQRLLSCRTERDSMLAFVWYNFCHYILRPWPWIIVGLLSLIYFPELKDAETCFPRMIDQFLPAGLKGIMVASMLAAFMSTLDTQLNWGASYLINDLYKPYLKPGRKPHHYVTASRTAMLLLTCTALLVSTRLNGILEAYKYIGVIGAGVGTVMIARWYWWRVNPWSEISALITALLIGNTIVFIVPDVKDASGKVIENYFTVRLLINTFGTLLVWVINTVLFSDKPCTQTLEFYKKMRINGPGWSKVAKLLSIEPEEGGLLNSTVCWLSCCVAMFSLLIGSGMLLFHEWKNGAMLIALTIVSSMVLIHFMKRVKFLDKQDDNLQESE
jgi:SSS family solute:Na+ symporter